MQAIEFISRAHEGVVDLPREHLGWNGKEVRVILLEAGNDAVPRNTLFKAATISTRGYQFNRDAANER